MSWREEWRLEDRPDAGEIPERYGLLSNVADNLMMGYFAGVLILAYLGLKFIGTQATLIAGIPVLIWLTVGVSVLIITGLYLSLTQADTSEDISDVTVEQGVKDD
ncbi:hypothetical protein [Haloarcula amylovorans]|uniref:hypothetical protein n=1 Tax=Haloarcula amylovorans TaxID=2562280 RepID=UPI001075EFAA|nr:hypothetical protein [Halomicroarcula amylolytica]